MLFTTTHFGVKLNGKTGITGVMSGLTLEDVIHQKANLKDGENMRVDLDSQSQEIAELIVGCRKALVYLMKNKECQNEEGSELAEYLADLIDRYEVNRGSVQI